MIRRVRIKRFKRFEDVTFELPGHIVVAGPNNTGKTTLLQAIAAFELALDRWRELGESHKHNGFFARAPLARQAFSAVPLRNFDLLWSGRASSEPIEIEVHHDKWHFTMELIPDSSEQIYVRPRRDADPEQVRWAKPWSVFVPAMSGLSVEEPVYTHPKVNQLLFQAKPGEVLRNLLVQASNQAKAWEALTRTIRELFDFELLPPDSRGAHIVAEYSLRTGVRLDIASAGSGFQQVLMLLAFLNTRPGAVLLLDEPDAHLHVILQDAIYGALRATAARQSSQLIIATHSEVLIDAVEPRELCLLLDQPRMIATDEERARLIASLGALSNEDIVLAQAAPGVLYLEDYTDLAILRAWARVLGHRALPLLTKQLFWRRTVHRARAGASGISAREHFAALELVRPDLPGLELVDGDAHPGIAATEITGHGLQRLRWRRYEIESYVFHPAALARFVTNQVGEAAAGTHVSDLQAHLVANHPPGFLANPLGDFAFLHGVKARTDLIPPALDAAGLHGFPYTRYDEIAAAMLPAEIHPEVVEKLGAIVKAFRQ